VHSKKIGTVFSVGLIHRFFIRLMPTAVIGVSLVPVKSFFDKADLAAAFYAGDSNIRNVLKVRVKAHVFLQIVYRDVIASHHLKIALAIAHDRIRPPFDQNSKAV
jgi:hypothetical protein